MWTCRPSRRRRSEPRRRSIARRASAGREAELRVVLAGGDRGVGVGPHAGDHAHEHALLVGHEALEAVDVVEVVDHDRADARVDRAPEVLVGLRVAVQVDARGVDARRQRVHQLAGPGDVAAQALLGDRAQDRRARERLRGEDGQRVAPARGQLVAVLARPLAQRALVDHVGRRAELGREVAQPAAADDELAAVVHGRARREEIEDGRSSAAVHHATMGPVLRVAALAIAPVKGMRTVAVDALELAASGPVGDRAFHVREDDGEIALNDAQPAPRADRARVERTRRASSHSPSPTAGASPRRSCAARP